MPEPEPVGFVTQVGYPTPTLRPRILHPGMFTAGNYSESATYYRACIDQAPDTMAFSVNLATVLNEMGEYEESVKVSPPMT